MNVGEVAINKTAINAANHQANSEVNKAVNKIIIAPQSAIKTCRVGYKGVPVTSENFTLTASNNAP